MKPQEKCFYEYLIEIAKAFANQEEMNIAPFQDLAFAMLNTDEKIGSIVKQTLKRHNNSYEAQLDTNDLLRAKRISRPFSLLDAYQALLNLEGVLNNHLIGDAFLCMLQVLEQTEQVTEVKLYNDFFKLLKEFGFGGSGSPMYEIEVINYD